MGVYIPDMEMPTDCGHCRFAIDGWCYAYGKPNIDALANDGRTNFCPLVPVPPHGDLIDKQYAYQNTMAMGEHMRKIILKQIDLLPTVIQAEEDEQ